MSLHVYPSPAGAESDPVAGAALTTHAALTTSAHGGVVASNDAALTNIRGAISAHKSANWYIPYALDGSGTNTPAAPTQDLVSYLPFLVGAAWTIDRIGVYVTVGGSAGAVLRFGIYNTDANGQPGTVFHDAGTVAADTTSHPSAAQAVVTPNSGTTGQLTLTANTWFWLAVVGQVATAPTTNRTILTEVPHRVSISASTIPSANTTTCLFYTQTGVTGAFATAGTLAASASSAPCVCVRSL